MSQVKIGCCGFPVSRKNYYRHFSCVEVQQTFYHPPELATLLRWRREAPQGFEFTIKAWQLIFQTPPSFRCTAQNKANIKEFFRKIERDGFILGWEPRGWEGREVQKLCRQLELVHIVDPFQDESLWGEITYWRLHGIGGYRYRYSDQDLAQLQQWVPEERITYVMFNNTSMFQDGLRFKQVWER